MTLEDKSHGIFQVQYIRSVPVWNVVNVALGGSGGYEIAISDRHVNNSVLEVKILLKFNILRQNISDFYSVL